MNNLVSKKSNPGQGKRITGTLLLLSATATSTLAQGVAGLESASTELTTYVDPVANMILIIGALVGLIGGVRVYIKWNSGDQDVQKSLMGWIGACLFLVTVGVVIRAFFGV
jgi:predicted aconitase with swiveling domain